MKYIYQLQLKNRRAAVIALNIEDALEEISYRDNHDWSDASVLRLASVHNSTVCQVLAWEKLTKTMKYIYHLTLKYRSAVVIATDVEDAQRLANLVDTSWFDARCLRLASVSNDAVCRVLAMEK